MNRSPGGAAMRHTRIRVTFLAACGLLLLPGLTQSADERPMTRPQTEKRFPPLKVPAGFKATLFASDPLVEYPSVIASGPRPLPLAGVPSLHRDPFDGLLIAQAIQHGLTLTTVDPDVIAYPVPVLPTI